ncbi:MAG: hypothetical protein ABIM30_10245 [candidate division WOR-3 bacterium]
MRLKGLLYVIPIMIVISAYGCKREDAESDDEVAIREIIVSSPYFSIEDAYFEGGFVTDSTNNSKGDTVLLGWWRSPVSISKNVWVNIMHDTARAEVNTHIYGKFRLVYLILNGSSIDTLKVEKSFHDIVKRYALFTRDGSIDDQNRGWALKAVSLGFCETKDLPLGPFFKIDSVRVTYTCDDTPVYSTTFSDFYSLISIDSLLWVGNEGILSFETWTSPVFPNVFAFFYGARLWNQLSRVRMRFNDSRFLIEINVPHDSLPLVSRFGLSVISKGSFSLDPNERYMSQGVIIPVLFCTNRD